MKTIKSISTVFLLAFLFISAASYSQGVVGTLSPIDLNFVTGNTHWMTLMTNGDLRVGVTNTTLGNANVAIGGGNSIDANSRANLVSGANNSAANAQSCVLGGIGNSILEPNSGSVTKSIGLGWNNRIQDHNQYLIGAANSALTEYSGVFGVDLHVSARGAWYLGGNAYAFLENNMPNSLAIGWDRNTDPNSGHHTALFDINGLTLGTSHQGGSRVTNTNDLATARLDVYAPDFTADNGTNYPSGVRFRDLPERFASILVVDDRGYVYDSKVNIEELLQGYAPDSGSELQKQVDELTQMVETLKNQIESIQNGSTNSQSSINSDLKIYPNPTNGNFSIEHFVPNNAQSATIIVRSMNGQEIMNTPISTNGKSMTNVHLPSSLSTGTYFCSFYVDGVLVNTEKIEFQKG